jgi:hypothetical protein
MAAALLLINIIQFFLVIYFVDAAQSADVITFFNCWIANTEVLLLKFRRKSILHVSINLRQ